MNYTQDQLNKIINESKLAAHKATLAYWQDILQGKDHDACGFAWVEIHGIKGNTKLGKMLKASGVDQNWNRIFQIWNPSGSGLQSISALEVGAHACAEVLRKHGFTAYANSRMD